MHFSKLLVVAAGLMGLAAAQSSTATSSSSSSGSSSSSSSTSGSSSSGSATTTSSAYPYTVPAVGAGAPPEPTAAAWCQAQMNSCLQLCGNEAFPNTCEPTSLTYNCTCSSGPTPDLTQYNETLPYFECVQYVSNCVAGNETNAQAQNECMSIQCGGKSPQSALSAFSSSQAAAAATTSSSLSTTASSTGTSAPPVATTTGATSKKNGAVAEIDPRTAYSTGAFIAGVFALISLVL